MLLSRQQQQQHQCCCRQKQAPAPRHVSVCSRKQVSPAPTCSQGPSYGIRSSSRAAAPAAAVALAAASRNSQHVQRLVSAAAAAVEASAPPPEAAYRPPEPHRLVMDVAGQQVRSCGCVCLHSHAAQRRSAAAGPRPDHITSCRQHSFTAHYN